jgi:hypothetical protein
MYNQSKSLFHRTPNHRNLTSKSAHYTPQFIDEIYSTYMLDANLNVNEHIQVAVDLKDVFFFFLCFPLRNLGFDV